MTIKYGDIVIMDFNPVVGSEISKIRPCLVVSRNEINASSKILIVLPITSNIKKHLPFHVIVKHSRKNGLSVHSKILTDQIKSLDKLRYKKTLGSLEDELLRDIEQKMAFVLNFPTHEL